MNTKITLHLLNPTLNAYIGQRVEYRPNPFNSDNKEIDPLSLFFFASSDDLDFFTEKIILMYKEFFCERIDHIFIQVENGKLIELKGGDIEKLKNNKVSIQELIENSLNN